ncbi:DUF6241 domain-containing protein [Priestia megaterium]|uniref:DUF6241 domain-containing protein n=1 Tax=Priestia megaterium TaxID=1404 RepID=UPI0025A32751|nr:DUF6241 domain-containing protein [Priestia megaterium]MDM8148519.1 DUF6241 domain-containing protein [Priestia megaterium]MED4116217.1 DUF6241 domain-containing protein [Priestia megaterium]
MLKFLYWTFIAGCIVVLAGLAILLIIDIDSKPVGKEISETQEETSIEEQTSYIGGTTEEVTLDENSTAMDAIITMHQMTHQKVYSADKWGAVKMTPENIAKVTDFVRSIEFEQKIDMLKILGRWERGDFSTIVEDHNYFWNIQGGNIGEATRALTEDEEKEFIANNF